MVRESTGKEVTVPLFFLLESILKIPLRWALGRCSFGVPAFFAFNRTITNTQHALLGGTLMPIDTADIFGSDQVGIQLAAVGNVLLHPLELPQHVLEILDATLQLERHPVSIGGSNLIGALVAGNSRGMAVADIATESDIDMLTSFGDVVVMEGGVNTAGNLLLVNERGAIASPSIPTDGLEIMADVMGCSSRRIDRCWTRCRRQRWWYAMIKVFFFILTLLLKKCFSSKRYLAFLLW